MSITKEDKFKAYYFGQMTVEDLADFQRKMGESEELQEAYAEYKILQDTFLAEEYDRNYTNSDPLTAADHRELYLYVEGDITDEARIASIKTRIKTDDAYREEYELMKDVALMDQEARKAMPASPTLAAHPLNKATIKTDQAKVRRLRPTIYRQLGIAASVLVVFALGWWALNRDEYDPEQVAGLLEAEAQQGIKENAVFNIMGLSGDSAEELFAKANSAFQAGKYEDAKALLLEVRASGTFSWKTNSEAQMLLISLVMKNAVKKEEQRQLAFTLMDELETAVRTDPIVFGNSEEIDADIFAPLLYKRAILLSLKDTSRNEAIKQLEAILEISSPLKGYQEKVEALRELID